MKTRPAIHNGTGITSALFLAIAAALPHASAQNFTITKQNQPLLPKGSLTQSGPITAAASKLCLDVQRASADDGLNVQLGSCQNGTASWDLIDLGGGEYAILNRLTRRVIDVAGGGFGDGTNVQQFTWNNSNAQRWRVETLPNGNFQIVNQSSGKCLDVSGNASNVGANIAQWRCHGGGNQQWQFARAAANAPRGGIFRSNAAPNPIAVPPAGVVSVGGEAPQAGLTVNTTPAASGAPAATLTGRLIYAGMIVNRANNKCLDAERSQGNDVAPVRQWTCNASGAQLWDFYDLGRGEVAIALRGTGKVLDVYGATANDGANIVPHPWNGGANQRWRLEAAGQGFFKMVSVNSSKCADADLSGGERDGSSMLQWECHGKNNQQWRIEVSGIGNGWNNYTPPAAVTTTNPGDQRISDAPPQSVIGNWEGYNPTYQSPIRLSIFSDGNALAVIDNNLRVNGYFRNGLLYLGTERYQVQSLRRGIRTVQVGNSSNSVTYTRVR
jgi:Ricin-type beta-trefoil lectin domain